MSGGREAGPGANWNSGLVAARPFSLVGAGCGGGGAAARHARIVRWGMDRIENRMAVYPEPHISPEITERFNGPGYKQLGTGVFVPEEDAFEYALEQCVETVPDSFFGIRWTEEFKEMLVEWFYSGNWISEEQ